jgi:hypothetical protein
MGWDCTVGPTAYTSQISKDRPIYQQKHCLSPPCPTAVKNLKDYYAWSPERPRFAISERTSPSQLAAPLLCIILKAGRDAAHAKITGSFSISRLFRVIAIYKLNGRYARSPSGPVCTNAGPTLRVIVPRGILVVEASNYQNLVYASRPGMVLSGTVRMSLRRTSIPGLNIYAGEACQVLILRVCKQKFASSYTNSGEIARSIFKVFKDVQFRPPPLSAGDRGCGPAGGVNRAVTATSNQ